jgi:hypothetical protein
MLLLLTLGVGATGLIVFEWVKGLGLLIAVRKLEKVLPLLVAVAGY